MPDYCRSCGSPIVWLTIHPGRRRMPVDVKPAADGNVLADLTAAAGVVLSRETVAVIAEDSPDEPLYRSHFATCPQAEKWRKR